MMTKVAIYDNKNNNDDILCLCFLVIDHSTNAS